jgi:SNF2 family DNA or RNA helicase
VIEFYPYQIEGAAWLTKHKFRLLADEPGLGKTAQVIRAVDSLKIWDRILILCPAIARYQWRDQFATVSSYARQFSVVEHKANFSCSGNGTICSYDLLTTRDIAISLLLEHWNVVVLDECHVLQNRNAKRTEEVYTNLLPRTDRLWAVSGTPARNHAGNLYPLLRAFGVVHMDYWAFMRRFTDFSYTPYRDIRVHRSIRIPELRQLLNQIMLRRRKDEVNVQLPDLRIQDVVVPPSEVELRSWHHEVIMGTRTIASVQEEVTNEMVTMQRLIDAVGPGSEAGLKAIQGLSEKCILSRQYVALSKVPAMCEMITEELKRGDYHKIVIFGHHKSVLKEVRERMIPFHPFVLWGGTPQAKKNRYIKEFQTLSHVRVAICNIQAAGTAITLTAAHEVAFIEQSYVPADNAQAMMRIHRLGQKEKCRARVFMLPDSIDTQVQRALARKTRDLCQMLGDQMVQKAPINNPNPFEGA